MKQSKNVEGNITFILDFLKKAQAQAQVKVRPVNWKTATSTSTIILSCKISYINGIPDPLEICKIIFSV